MVKLNEKECLDTKMSDLVNFSKLLFNMFSVVLSLFAHFWMQFLSNFDVWVLILKLMTYSTRIWSHFATRGLIRYLKKVKICPKIVNISKFLIRYLKKVKICPKIVNVSKFLICFCHFKVPWRPLVEIWEEEVLCFILPLVGL